MSVHLTHVVAAVVFNDHGQFLLSSRPKGKVYAGFWEFAGGKVEEGETELAALQRELQEELAIQISGATPWLTKIYQYEHAHVYLRFYRVLPHQWQGQIVCQEQQQYSWQSTGQLNVEPMLPANGPILRALALPWESVGSWQTGWLGQNGMRQVRLAHDDAADVVLLNDDKQRDLPDETLQLLPWSLNGLSQNGDADGWWWRPESAQQIEQAMSLLQKQPLDMPMLVILDKECCHHQASLQQIGWHVAVCKA